MKRLALWVFALVAVIGIVAIFATDIGHLITAGLTNGDHPAIAATDASETDHGAKDAHDDGDADAHGEEDGDGDAHGEEENSVVELTEAQVALAGIESVEATLDQIDLIVQLTGEVQVNQDRVVQVVPRVPGVVRSVSSFLGDDVKKGTVLAAIDSRDLADAKSAFTTARERTNLARAKFTREDTLWRKRITSEQEFLDAESALKEAEIAEEAAAQKLHALGLLSTDVKSGPGADQASLTLFDVVAPFAGTIIEKNVTTGASVNISEPIFRIADLETVWVIASVYEKDIARISKGQPASVVTDAYPDQVFRGRITWVADTLHERTRTLKVRIEVNNRDRQLKPGMFVRADVVVDKREGVVTVPDAAVRRSGKETIAFVDEGNGRFAPRDLALGIHSNGMVEVVEGLQPGERVVAEGSFVLKSELEKGGFGGGHGH